MKKYCLHLMGLDTYIMEKKKLPMIIQDVVNFMNAQKEEVKVSQNGVIIKGVQFSLLQLKTKEGKQKLFNMVREKSNV